MDTDLEKAKRLVEGALGELGLDAAACRVPPSPKAAPGPTPSGSAQARATTAVVQAWTFKRGSASLLVSLNRRENEGPTLRAGSPLVTLPAESSRRVALFQHLLELNAAGLSNAAFGLAGDRVVVVSERPVQGLEADEVEQMIRHLAAVADAFDGRLEKEFGAPKA